MFCFANNYCKTHSFFKLRKESGTYIIKIDGLNIVKIGMNSISRGVKPQEVYKHNLRF
jgi:hypothetical protein